MYINTYDYIYNVYSLHSAIPELRKKLVPSSRHYEPTVLRDGLINSLLSYKPQSTTHKPHRSSVMIAITLLHNINTSKKDAEHLVVFLQPFRDKGIKVVIHYSYCDTYITV